MTECKTVGDNVSGAAIRDAANAGLSSPEEKTMGDVAEEPNVTAE